MRAAGVQQHISSGDDILHPLSISDELRQIVKASPVLSTVTRRLLLKIAHLIIV